MNWDIGTAGVSLAVFNATHTFIQTILTGTLSKRLGDRGVLLLGMGADMCGFLLLAFITQSWMVLPAIFMLATGGIGMPALQAIISGLVCDEKQGALQGTLTGLTNITSIIGPVGFTTLYGLTAGQWDGWVWLVAASLYLIVIYDNCFSIFESLLN